MKSHKTTFMKLEELGNHFPSYQPTFDFQGDFVDASHKFLAECPVKDGFLIQIKNRRWLGSIIKGWQRREDALKLYEMAYFVQGDILELGSYHGLGTCILSLANHKSPHRKKVFSVDLDPLSVLRTTVNLYSMGLKRDVTTICADAAAIVKTFAHDRKKFEFVFIDHSHAYEPVYNVCRELETIVSKGGFCLFHDFNDPRNKDAEDSDYAVYQAVLDGMNSSSFDFYGIYGCTALYRAV